MSELLQGERLEASLTVNNLERSVAWYCSALGFSELKQQGGSLDPSSALVGRILEQPGRDRAMITGRP